jgi:hypothetical protein
MGFGWVNTIREKYDNSCNQKYVKCGVCRFGNNEFDGVDQLGQHIEAQHINKAPDVVHYLAKLEERLNALQEKK